MHPHDADISLHFSLDLLDASILSSHYLQYQQDLPLPTAVLLLRQYFPMA